MIQQPLFHVLAFDHSFIAVEDTETRMLVCQSSQRVDTNSKIFSCFFQREQYFLIFSCFHKFIPPYLTFIILKKPENEKCTKFDTLDITVIQMLNIVINISCCMTTKSSTLVKRQTGIFCFILYNPHACDGLITLGLELIMSIIIFTCINAKLWTV